MQFISFPGKNKYVTLCSEDVYEYKDGRHDCSLKSEAKASWSPPGGSLHYDPASSMLVDGTWTKLKSESTR